MKPKPSRKEAFDKLFEAVSPEDLAEVTKGLLDVLKATEDRLKGADTASEEKLRKEIGDVIAKLEDAERRLASFVEETKNLTKSEIDEQLNAISADVEALWSSLPKDFDATDLINRIAEVESKIPTLPKEKSREEIRDSLESIEDEEEKLKIEAIGNLRKELDELKKDVKTFVGGGGAQGGITAVHAPLHEEFTMDGVATTVTLSQGVGAAGKAIFALRYQGQVLDMTTHYTVNGNLITLVGFVPVSGSIISITYLS